MADIEKSNLNIIIPGTGCCSSELLAARGPVYDIQRFGINFVNNAENVIVQPMLNNHGINKHAKLQFSLVVMLSSILIGNIASSMNNIPMHNAIKNIGCIVLMILVLRYNIT